MLKYRVLFAEGRRMPAFNSISPADHREIILFDSTGTALQDVISAIIIFERASRNPDILRVNLGSA